jgi:hypothetical protein
MKTIGRNLGRGSRTFVWVLSIVLAAGCGGQEQPKPRIVVLLYDDVEEEAGPVDMLIVGFNPIGAPGEVSLEPSYAVDGEFVGEGLAGFRNVLTVLQQLPPGSRVSLHREVAFVIPKEQSSGYVGATGTGPHCFLSPPELFNELQRIATERQLQLEFVPPIDGYDSLADVDSQTPGDEDEPQSQEFEGT